MAILTFFNNKGGVGKSTFSYHMAYMLENKGARVLMVDLDPQCNLTAHVCHDETIENLWSSSNNTVYHAVRPLISGAGDILNVRPHKVENRNLFLIAGDLLLSDFESYLAESWVQVLAGQERGFRSFSAIYRMIKKTEKLYNIDYTIVDMGPNFGSLNRSIMLSCDAFFVPMIPDLFSLRGTQNLGRVLANWISQYKESIERAYHMDFDIPEGRPVFSGQVTQQFNIYRRKETLSWQRWAAQIPDYIDEYVIKPLINNVRGQSLVANLENFKLGDFKNYHSLIPMAQAAHKPVFELKYADGVIGDHSRYVKQCYSEFEEMEKRLKSILNMVMSEKVNPYL